MKPSHCRSKEASRSGSTPLRRRTASGAPKRCGIKIYRYATSDAQGSRDNLVGQPASIEGCLYDQAYRAVDHASGVVEEIEKLGPEGLGAIEYPSEALHEIITNAVIHRDYSIATDIQVRIFDNRVEVESPGKLPGHITIQNILRDQFARNPKIVRLINKFPNPPNKDVGEGLNTAFEAMEKLRLKQPEIRELDTSVLVTLRHEKLASPEQMVMEYMANHDVITNSIARQLTGIRSENTMKEVFYGLDRTAQLERVPGRRGSASAWRKPANDTPEAQETIDG